MEQKQKQQYTYSHPRPMVTVDAVLFTVRECRLEVLVIRRRRPPFQGMWALPGGFVDQEETLDDAVQRELHEETGIKDVVIDQFYTFGDPGRDPRGRVITVAYYGVVDWHELDATPGDDAEDVAWLPVDALPQMASDHNAIVQKAFETLQQHLAYQAVDPLALVGPIPAEDLRCAIEPAPLVEEDL